jgi:hypothetical protein
LVLLCRGKKVVVSLVRPKCIAALFSSSLAPYTPPPPVLSLLAYVYVIDHRPAVCCVLGKRERSVRVNKANIANGKVAPVYTRPAPVCMQMRGAHNGVCLSFTPPVALFARAWGENCESAIRKLIFMGNSSKQNLTNWLRRNKAKSVFNL